MAFELGTAQEQGFMNAETAFLEETTLIRHNILAESLGLVGATTTTICFVRRSLLLTRLLSAYEILLSLPHR